MSAQPKPPMSPTSRRLIDDFLVYSEFRRKYPTESEEIRGRIVPTSYRGSVPTLLSFAQEQIRAGKGRSALQNKR